METIDRSKFYKKATRFGAQTLYESDILSKVSLQHWENFDGAVKSGEGFKVGDFIDIAVNTTAIQLVKFLDEFTKCETMDELKSKAKIYIDEIQKEVDKRWEILMKKCETQ